MKKKGFSSLKGFIVIMFIITAIIYVAIISNINVMVRKQAELYLNESTEQNINAINIKLNCNIDLLKSIALFISRYEDFSSLDVYKILSQQAEQNDLYRISAINTHGTSYTSDGYINNLSEKEYFKAAISGDVYISDIIDSNVDDETYIVIAVPIYRDKNIVGVLSGVYHADILYDLFGVKTFDGKGYNYVVNKYGDALLKTNAIKFNGNIFDILNKSDNSDYTVIEEMKYNIENGIEGVLQYKHVGELKYMKYKPIMKNGWFIVSVIPSSSINKQSDYIAIMVLILCLIIFIMFVLLIYFVNYNNKKNEKILIKKAECDSFTQLYNKVTTRYLIDNCIQGEGNNGTHAMIILDIDNFKQINDTFGHNIGDEVILKATSEIKTLFRTSDIIGRVGGDEFVIFLENFNSREIIDIKIKEIIDAFDKIKIHDSSFNVSASIGVSIYPQDGLTYDELFEKSDKALYESKANGKGLYTIYK